jgi:hypothetical protein
MPGVDTHNPDPNEFDNAVEEIRKVLANKNLSVESLTDSLTLPETKSLKVIRWLLDNDRLVLGKDQTLKWNEKK